MAPVLKTGEAFRVSVGSNPTPSAPTTTKVAVTCPNSRERKLGPARRSPTQSRSPWFSLACCDKCVTTKFDRISGVVLVDSEVERRLDTASRRLVLSVDALGVHLQEDMDAVPCPLGDLGGWDAGV